MHPKHGEFKQYIKKVLLVFLILLMGIVIFSGCKSNTIEKPIVAGTIQKTTSSKENINKGEDTVNGTLKVHFIDVGQGDSILITQDGKNMLIDAGNNPDGPLVVNYLKKQGITKLDYLIGTHPHEDHLGGIDIVIKAFSIDKVYLPKTTANTATFKDVITAITNKSLKITTPVVGSTFNVGEATATILAPNNAKYEDANNYSIVLKLKFGNTNFIFMGDAENISEGEILAKQLDIKADVIKIGHHGSSSSTSQKFLDKVSPKYAVISVGKNNDYGHPHQSTMDKLKTKGIIVYRTDENGSIVATSDGQTITFNSKPGSYSYNGLGNTINNTAEKTKNPGEIKDVDLKDNNSKTVFFTKNGKSYHLSKNCRTFKSNSVILQGTLAEAINLGHSDPCNICAN